MKTLYFKCTLQTDVVLNLQAATEGNQKTLDFIPGNNFLGIVAGQLYHDLTPEESLLMFHSGKVRFGDAHPEKEGKRSLRIPASMYKPKNESTEEGLYIHHEVFNPDDEIYKKFQPKQCRAGFYLFENNRINEVKVRKSFAVKSAYDRKMRRSEDEKMYGYESLNKGSSWLFEVTVDDDCDCEIKITESLKGIKHIGRSRTAQYGLISIEHLQSLTTHDRAMIKPKYNEKECHHYILMYADSRLIFLDEFASPTFQPDVTQHFKLDGCEIWWKYSQIRTFEYVPWNSKRHARDTDRCGIEKGSVFYVKVPDDKEIEVQSFVGLYQNEGFGKVIYNPDFLRAAENLNGKALYKFPEDTNNENNVKTEDEYLDITDTGPVLIKYLILQHNTFVTDNKIYNLVNSFVAQQAKRFADDKFASQWGTIRSIAMSVNTRQGICDKLFKGKTGYLMHGEAVISKWNKRNRRDVLKTFIDDELKSLKDKEFQAAIINLCSEMSKISKK